MAVMHNLKQIEEDAGYEERLGYLAGQGFLTLPKAEKPAFEPVERAVVKGEPVSETIVRERR